MVGKGANVVSGATAAGASLPGACTLGATKTFEGTCVACEPLATSTLMPSCCCGASLPPPQASKNSDAISAVVTRTNRGMWRRCRVFSKT